MEEPDGVILTQADGVLTITLNEPEGRNALTPGIEHGLIRGIAAATSADVRCVVLTGSGGAFCAGGDMREMGQIEQKANIPALRARTRALPDRILRPLSELEKPVVAALNGWVVGAGVGIALAADFRIASSRCKFLIAFERVGLIPDLGTAWALPRLVGYRAARDLMYRRDPVGAERALELGLVDELVEPEALMTRTAEFAADLAERPTLAMGLAKRLLQESFSLDLDTFLRREVAAQGVALGSEDYQEGRVAFREKRSPKFNGQ